MTDLVEFLRARLDEDRLLALTAKCDGRTGRDRWSFVDSGDDLVGGVVRDGTDDRVADDLYRVHALHIARHDPARVLREVGAKRRIIERYEQQAAKQYENAAEEDRAWTLEPVLSDLALPYADHPDYREEWRPA